MREYVRLQTAILLRRLAFEVSRAGKSSNAESVHDLRVAVRRFSRCLRLFSQFYPGKSWKKVRHRLDTMMQSAGAVRDLDIALELFAEAGLGKDTVLFRRLGDERRQAHRQLVLQVRGWRVREFSKKWRSRLGLSV